VRLAKTRLETVWQIKFAVVIQDAYRACSVCPRRPAGRIFGSVRHMLSLHFAFP
jgi:hypothetical protein